MPRAAAGEDLAAHYEALRHLALSRGVPGAGLGAALLAAKGMPAWARGWRACAPSPPRRAVATMPSPPAEIVGVLAAMALACA